MIMRLHFDPYCLCRNYQYLCKRAIRKSKSWLLQICQMLIPSNETLLFVKRIKFHESFGSYGDLLRPQHASAKIQNNWKYFDFRSGNFQSFTPFPSSLNWVCYEVIWSTWSFIQIALSWIHSSQIPNRAENYWIPRRIDTPASVRNYSIPYFLEKKSLWKNHSVNSTLRFFLRTIYSMIPMPEIAVFLSQYLALTNDPNQIISDADKIFD